jgi:hypothetical protein
MHFVFCKEKQPLLKTKKNFDYGVAEAPPGYQACWLFT